MKLVNLALSTITPYWRNPRNSDGSVAAVKKSIQEFGFNSPLILDSDHCIIAGHTRYRAMMELGIKKADCVITDLTPEQARAYRIADNKTSELGEWKIDNLTAELRELTDLSSMAIFFPDVDLEAMMQETVSQMEAVTQEQINKHTDAANDYFADTTPALFDIPCPHCNKTFAVNLDKLKREQARS